MKRHETGAEIKAADDGDIRVVSVLAVPVDAEDSIFSERVFTVSICDEGAGECLEIKDGSGGAFIFNESDWPTIKKGVEYMLENIVYSN